jgi:predicted branched-subunit amino acid permease
VREPSQRVLRDSLGVGVATGAYGISFGALAIAGGFTIPETCTLSLLMFTGGSQFAIVSTVTSGGSAFAGAATAILLGSRNALYGLSLSSLLRVRGWRRLATAQLVIDESTAMALGQDNDAASRYGFYATGIAVFVLWNLATLIGALGARSINDPGAYGLDAAASAAFVALLAPRLKTRTAWVTAFGAMAVALALTPLFTPGVPVLCAALVAVAAGWREPRAPRVPGEPR